MKVKSVLIATAAAAAIALAAFATVEAQPYGPGGMMGGYGPPWMHGYGPDGGPGGSGGPGPGWHGGRGGGPGWMMGGGPGWGRGSGYGPCRDESASGQSADLKLTTDQVKNRLENWIGRTGNPHIKVGDVKEKDADTIAADIVTQDNSLVQRFEVNRHSGFWRPSGS